MGTTGMVAQASGREDGTAVRTLLAQSLILATVIGSLIILLRTPVTELALRLMDPEVDVLGEARAYASIRAFGAPAMLCNYALLGWFVGNQNTRIPLVLLTVSNLINMLLNVFFVYGLGMHADGVALGSVIAEWASLALGLWFVRGMLRKIPGQWLSQPLRRLRDYSEMFRVNRYLFVRTVAILLSLAFFTSQGAKQGTDILSANAVLLNFVMLISNALDGFAHATEALSGRVVGKGRREEFYRTVVSAGIWSLVSALLLMMIFALGGNLIISMLTGIEAVRNEAAIYLPWLIVMPLIGVWSFLLDGVFIGTTQVKAMQNTMLLSVLCVYLPVWWLSQPLGNHGLWLALLSLFAARGVSGAWVFWRISRRDAWAERG